MKTNTIYHYGKKDENGYYVMNTKNGAITQFKSIPTKAISIEGALCMIIHSNVLKFMGGIQRVSRYKCIGHGKIHRYSFHNCISWVPGMQSFLGVDTAKELIHIANGGKIND